MSILKREADLIKLDVHQQNANSDKLFFFLNDTKVYSLTFEIRDGINAVDLTNVSIVIIAKRADGSVVEDSVVVTDAWAGKCSYEVKNSIYSQVGKVDFELELIQNDKKLSTSKFSAQVISDLEHSEGIPGTDEYPILLQLIADTTSAKDAALEAAEAAGRAADPINGQVAVHKTASVLDHPDGSVTGTKIAERTITGMNIDIYEIRKEHLTEPCVGYSNLGWDVFKYVFKYVAVSGTPNFDTYTTAGAYQIEDTANGQMYRLYVDILKGQLNFIKLQTLILPDGRLAWRAYWNMHWDSWYYSARTIKNNDGTYTLTDLVGDGAVTQNKLGAGAVTTGKIADEAVTVDKLASDSVDIRKLKKSGLNMVMPVRIMNDFASNGSIYCQLNSSMALSQNDGLLDIADGGVVLSKLGANVKAAYSRSGAFIIASSDSVNKDGADYIVTNTTGNYLTNVFTTIFARADWKDYSKIIIRHGYYRLPTGLIITKPCFVEYETPRAISTSFNNNIAINANNVVLSNLFCDSISVAATATYTTINNCFSIFDIVVSGSNASIINSHSDEKIRILGDKCRVLNSSVWEEIVVSGNTNYLFGNHDINGAIPIYTNTGLGNVIETAKTANFALNFSAGGSIESALNGRILTSQRGAANGVAGLGEDSIVVEPAGKLKYASIEQQYFRVEATLGANASFFTVSGLDINAHKQYIIEYTLKSSAASTNVRFKFNDPENNGANNLYKSITSWGGITTDCAIANQTPGVDGYTTGRIELRKAIGNKVIASARSSTRDSANAFLGTIQQADITLIADVENVTSITFVSAIAAGSMIKIRSV